MKYLTRRYPDTNNELWEDFESFFNAPSPFMPSFNSLFNWDSNAYRPAVDLYEDEANYFVQVEIPGFDRKEIDVELEKDRLVLKGARKTGDKDAKSEVSFHRSVTLPDSVKAPLRRN